MSDAVLHTDRLSLRRWRAADREPFARLNADPEVMRYFPTPLDRERSDALADDLEEGIERDGFGLWAVDLDGVGFVGFVGLRRIQPEIPPAPGVEVGWRLAREHWGQGLAPEAARAALAYGFDELELPEIVSFTAEINSPSRRVMEKIGMEHDPARNFDHPVVPDGSPLGAHVLYGLARPSPARRRC